jgi:glycosyltransferase involved in cell wall biosynthesis
LNSYPDPESGANVTAAPPTLSVLLPAYNAARYVAEAVESILAQTYTDFEFLIVDDGSTDDTPKILRRYAERDRRIHFVSRPNTGYVIALNEMLARARGEFIARMDADDIALPRRFECQMSYLSAHPECVMIGSRVVIIDPDGSPLSEMGEALTHEEIDSALMTARGQIVYHPSVIIRKQSILDVGAYRPEHNTAEDLDLFLRLAEIGRIANLAEPLLRYREHMGKVGHIHAAEQAETIRRVLQAAYQRRGQDLPREIFEKKDYLVDSTERQRNWAWWALSAGNVTTARKHAVGCLIRDPFSVETWRVLYCALRGH